MIGALALPSCQGSYRHEFEAGSMAATSQIRACCCLDLMLCPALEEYRRLRMCEFPRSGLSRRFCGRVIFNRGSCRQIED